MQSTNNLPTQELTYLTFAQLSLSLLLDFLIIYNLTRNRSLTQGQETYKYLMYDVYVYITEYCELKKNSYFLEGSKFAQLIFTAKDGRNYV